MRILVNNAGIFGMGPLLEVTPESYDKIFGVNMVAWAFPETSLGRRCFWPQATAITSLRKRSTSTVAIG
jgi:NAD(P)-dependent dehydrogenase (short-subunit alcohol dehydrogenase family)